MSIINLLLVKNAKSLTESSIKKHIKSLLPFEEIFENMLKNYEKKDSFFLSKESYLLNNDKNIISNRHLNKNFDDVKIEKTLCFDLKNVTKSSNHKKNKNFSKISLKISNIAAKEPKLYRNGVGFLSYKTQKQPVHIFSDISEKKSALSLNRKKESLEEKIVFVGESKENLSCKLNKKETVVQEIKKKEKTQLRSQEKEIKENSIPYKDIYVLNSTKKDTSFLENKKENSFAKPEIPLKTAIYNKNSKKIDNFVFLSNKKRDILSKHIAFLKQTPKTSANKPKKVFYSKHIALSSIGSNIVNKKRIKSKNNFIDTQKVELKNYQENENINTKKRVVFVKNLETESKENNKETKEIYKEIVSLDKKNISSFVEQNNIKEKFSKNEGSVSGKNKDSKEIFLSVKTKFENSKIAENNSNKNTKEKTPKTISLKKFQNLSKHLTVKNFKEEKTKDNSDSKKNSEISFDNRNDDDLTTGFVAPFAKREERIEIKNNNEIQKIEGEIENQEKNSLQKREHSGFSEEKDSENQHHNEFEFDNTSKEIFQSKQKNSFTFRLNNAVITATVRNEELKMRMVAPDILLGNDIEEEIREVLQRSGYKKAQMSIKDKEKKIKLTTYGNYGASFGKQSSINVMA